MPNLHGYQNLQNFVIFLTWLSHPTTSKYCYLWYGFIPPQFQNFTNPPRGIFLDWCSHLIKYVELSRWKVCAKYIIVVSNITVLVSHSVLFFEYFMRMSHGVNKKTPPSAFPHLPFPTRFSADLFVVFKKYFIDLLLFWSDYCER